MLRKAMDGIGCTTELVNEIFCTLSNAEIKQMQEAYERSSDSRLVRRATHRLSHYSSVIE
jgi:hypothetical protein